MNWHHLPRPCNRNRVVELNNDISALLVATTATREERQRTRTGRGVHDRTQRNGRGPNAGVWELRSGRNGHCLRPPWQQPRPSVGMRGPSHAVPAAGLGQHEPLSVAAGSRRLQQQPEEEEEQRGGGGGGGGGAEGGGAGARVPFWSPGGAAGPPTVPRSLWRRARKLPQLTESPESLRGGCDPALELASRCPHNGGPCVVRHPFLERSTPDLGAGPRPILPYGHRPASAGGSRAPRLSRWLCVRMHRAAAAASKRRTPRGGVHVRWRRPADWMHSHPACAQGARAKFRDPPPRPPRARGLPNGAPMGGWDGRRAPRSRTATPAPRCAAADLPPTPPPPPPILVPPPHPVYKPAESGT
eukprot:gene22982-biopygen5792